MEELLVEHQKNAKQDREKKVSRKDTGMSQEDMMRVQEEMFAQAKARLQSGMNPVAE
jgi:hypothetical protein